MLDKADGKSASSTESNITTGKAPVNTADTNNELATTADNVPVKSFMKNDFIPGKQIVYDENFDQEAIGELPTG